MGRGGSQRPGKPGLGGDSLVPHSEAEREEVVGVLGSSVLLDPEITIESSKNEILWTFKASNKSPDNILDHIPGVTTFEPSEQFKDRLQFNATNGALMINRLEASDEGNYTYFVDGKELKIIQLLVIEKMKEVIGILNSSVLLDPELKVDPSKNEIVWTFIGNSILHHVPHQKTTEYTEQFESRLKFNTSNGVLTVNGLTPGDQGNYSFIVNEQEMKILQLLIFEKLSNASIFIDSYRSLGFTVQLTCDVDGDANEFQWQKDGGEISQRHRLIDGNMTLVIQYALVSDCGSYTCVAKNPISSIRGNRSIILIGVLGIAFYFLSIAVCHTVADVAFLAVVLYWSNAQGLSPLVVVTSSTLITGLLLSSLNINTFVYLPWTRTSNQEIFRRIKIWFNWLSL
ncbi:hemicentin-1-like isoform X4 [Hypanus sabinus]|uniref:hemicentin-1-like isoform X4 n=1 Tax=Hypanus sabinus TaxID=79690 RepID=UPI0028C48B09|nr:hemicentin-1-like isoform X4 [Hypanus sabinus]